MTNTIKYSNQCSSRKHLTIIEKYWLFCDKQAAALWFILPVFILPCVIFTIGFFIQYLNNQPEIWYFTICGISLYSNILPNFANASTRLTISIFIFTILLHLILWLVLIY